MDCILTTLSSVLKSRRDACTAAWHHTLLNSSTNLSGVTLLDPCTLRVGLPPELATATAVGHFLCDILSGNFMC